jgi:hypothetical protein
MAGTFRDRKAQAALSHMARAWLALADRYQDRMHLPAPSPATTADSGREERHAISRVARAAVQVQSFINLAAAPCALGRRIDAQRSPRVITARRCRPNHKEECPARRGGAE